jgi:Uma2 family endonuclease
MVAPATNPTARLITAEEMAEIPEPDDGARYELVRGVIQRVSEPPGMRHGSIAMRLGFALGQIVYPRRLGVVWVESGVITERDPDTVRGPDVAFLSAARVPPGGLPVFFEGGADIIAEIVSPDDRASKLLEKVAEYLAAGTRLVWVVDPRPRTVTAYDDRGTVRRYTAAATLDAGDVLPELATPVAELFADLDAFGEA